MPLPILFRLASVAAVLLLSLAMPGPKAAYSFVYALGFMHYGLGFYYSRSTVREIMQKPAHMFFFFILISAGFLLYWSGFSLIIYFAFHQAFNEAYLVNPPAEPGQWRHKPESLLASSLACLIFFIFLFVVRHEPFVRVLPVTALMVLSGLSGLWFFAVLVLTRKKIQNPEQWSANLWLGLWNIALGLMSVKVRVEFLQIVAYHIIFWIFYPAWKMGVQVQWKRLASFLVLSFGLIAVFFMISPVGFHPYRLGGSWYFEQFYFWSYLHITVSFALSNAHPDWIIRLFRPFQTASLRV